MSKKKWTKASKFLNIGLFSIYFLSIDMIKGHLFYFRYCQACLLSIGSPMIITFIDRSLYLFDMPASVVGTSKLCLLLMSSNLFFNDCDVEFYSNLKRSISRSLSSVEGCCVECVSPRVVWYLTLHKINPSQDSYFGHMINRQIMWR